MNALDLFCGAAGGWSLGLHRAGIETVAACEIDPWRREVFSRNFPKVRMYGDIATLTAAQLERDGIAAIDIIVGSPPCQDASLANPKGEGIDGKRTGLFFEAIRLVSELRPHWAVFENVPGLRARGYDRVHDELEALGYQVRALVVGAWHTGAPHRRDRVWIIANIDGLFADTDKARCGLRECTEIPTVRNQARSIKPQRHSGISFFEKWSNWNQGFAQPSGMDDGVSPELDSVRGLGRSCIAAYGDAVVPQITEVLGKAIVSLANR